MALPLVRLQMDGYIIQLRLEAVKRLTAVTWGTDFRVHPNLHVTEDVEHGLGVEIIPLVQVVSVYIYILVYCNVLVLRRK